jgi:bacterioferritin-associated ferredoxin
MAAVVGNVESHTGVSSHCGRKATMTADILKRKLRNFPVANLSVRIATA